MIISSGRGRMGTARRAATGYGGMWAGRACGFSEKRAGLAPSPSGKAGVSKGYKLFQNLAKALRILSVMKEIGGELLSPPFLKGDLCSSVRQEFMQEI